MKFFQRMARSIGKKRRDKADAKLLPKEFCIISNDCWGGGYYLFTQRAFNTPFIGLFVEAQDYVTLLERLSYYLEQPLSFVTDSNTEYPVAMLDNVRLHFLHYSTKEEAADKWQRRVARLQAFIAEHGENALVIKMCDKYGCPILANSLSLSLHE